MAPPPPPPQLAAISYHRRRKPVVSSLLLLLLLPLVSYNSLCFSQTVVENLPGFPGKLPFRLETGYISVDEREEVQLFYYFIESERSPEDDPLMLWLTGGPGCSSLFGIIHKIGPFVVDYTNSSGNLPVLELNKDSWTQVANIVFVDQPAGTGFSYANTSKPHYTNDTLSATLTYEFLRKWLINHPKYAENPLYIGGDSYGGIIVPLVVNQVYNGIEAGIEPHMNMKGYVAGNPVTDRYADINGRILYAHRMGLLSDALYQSAKAHCNGNYMCVDSENVLCLNDLERINQCLGKIFMGMILEPSCDSLWKEKRDILSWHIPYEELPTNNNILQLSVAHTTKSWCRHALYEVFHTWANDKSVQKALHIREGTIPEWVRCNRTLQRSTPRPGGTKPYTFNVQSVVPYHQYFTRKSCRALIYSGDHDMGIPHTATEKWIESLKQPILSDWRPWFVGGQVAGYTMTYGHSDYELTYATVKAGGHTAAEYKPTECFAMISRWFDENSL